MKRHIRVIKKIPKLKYYTKWGFPIFPKKASCKVFQWPNGSYSLFVRKPTKTPGRYFKGVFIGMFYDLSKAKEAARKWLYKNEN